MLLRRKLQPTVEPLAAAQLQIKIPVVKICHCSTNRNGMYLRRGAFPASILDGATHVRGPLRASIPDGMTLSRMMSLFYPSTTSRVYSRILVCEARIRSCGEICELFAIKFEPNGINEMRCRRQPKLGNSGFVVKKERCRRRFKPAQERSMHVVRQAQSCTITDSMSSWAPRVNLMTWYSLAPAKVRKTVVPRRQPGLRAHVEEKFPKEFLRAFREMRNDKIRFKIHDIIVTKFLPKSSLNFLQFQIFDFDVGSQSPGRIRQHEQDLQRQEEERRSSNHGRGSQSQILNGRRRAERSALLQIRSPLAPQPPQLRRCDSDPETVSELDRVRQRRSEEARVRRTYERLDRVEREREDRRQAHEVASRIAGGFDRPEMRHHQGNCEQFTSVAQGYEWALNMLGNAGGLVTNDQGQFVQEKYIYYI